MLRSGPRIEPNLLGPDYRGIAVSDAELGEKVLEVRLDCVYGDEHGLRDFLVALPSKKPGEYLFLPLGQRFRKV